MRLKTLLVFCLFVVATFAVAVYGQETAENKVEKTAIKPKPKTKLLFKSDLYKNSRGVKLSVGDKPDGYRTAPVIAEKDGIRYVHGSCEIATKPINAIVTIKFDFLGFESTVQQDMIFINSNKDQPFAVIRNINSSARINGRHVVSVNNKYRKDYWHKVEILLNTRRGYLTVITDNQKRYHEKTAVKNARFTGIRFSEMPRVSNLSIEATMLPPVTAEEKSVRRIKPSLEKQIRNLPADSDDEIRKKAVLFYHLEKIDKALDQQAFNLALEIISDIKVGLTMDMGRKDFNHPWLRPVEQENNNPFLDEQMNEKWYSEFVSKPDYEWKLATEIFNSYNSINGAHGSRTQGGNANSWMLLYSHPQSPLKDKTELLIRALCRIDAYISGYHYHETLDTNGFLNDFFALGPALMGAVMIDQTFPEMLLPKQKEIWMASAEKAAQRFYKMNYTGNYSNADLGAARIFINSALFTGNKEDLEHGMKLAYSWEDNIYEDGASAYIAKQNESPGYHGACIDIEYDNFLMTSDNKLVDIIKRTEYYPISATDSNLTTEWYTVPSWKQSWYSADPVGVNPIIYYLTGNQYHKAIRGRDFFDKATAPSIKKALVYKSYPYVKKTLPNNYTVYDRNIQGVRMNYGVYSAAMNGRVTDQTVGKNTFVGLTIAEPRQVQEKELSVRRYTASMRFRYSTNPAAIPFPTRVSPWPSDEIMPH